MIKLKDNITIETLQDLEKLAKQAKMDLDNFVLSLCFIHKATNQTFKVNGKIQTWKRNPSLFRIPIKYGFYTYGYLSNWSHWKGSKFIEANNLQFKIML